MHNTYMQHHSGQMIVEAFVRALPMLGDVLIFAAFYFSIFGIATVELFKGRFYNRCGSPVFSTASQVYNPDGTVNLVVSVNLAGCWW